MTSWLVTGATGLLGSNAALTLSETGTVVCTSRRLPQPGPLPFIHSQLESAESRSGLVARSGADAVFHAAALSSIDACESDPALARELNVIAPVDLATQAREAGAAFVYISTDAVFDGIDGGYSEDSRTSPASEYGRTKVLGEQAVLDAYPEALVARVNFYGWSPTARRSVAEFFYYSLQSGRNVTGFTDIVVNTLQVSYLVDAIEKLVAKVRFRPPPRRTIRL
jgi:dTDP-4-dehydrorhamnose reductase